jgi:hypothetical protein
METILAVEAASRRYVGFLDVLGFSHRVLSNFDDAVAPYNSLMKFADLGDMASKRPGMSVRVLSDAIVVTSPHLHDIVAAANTLQMASLASQNCLLRGGIGHGLHIESQADGHLFVVSEPLVRAVAVEKTIRHPCIALAEGILPSPGAWLPYPNNFQRPLLYYQGKWLVNPLTIAWGVSAAQRVASLKEEHPEHCDKYDWFLEFHRHILEGAPLTPSVDEWSAMSGCIREGLPVLPDA